MRRAPALIALTIILSLPCSGLAQPFVLGPEIDPIPFDATPLAGGDSLRAPGGFAIVQHASTPRGDEAVLQILRSDLTAVGPLRRVAAPVIAVGETTYLMWTRMGAWMRAAHADDVPLDPPATLRFSAPIAVGDDYVFFGVDSVAVWRAGEPASAIVVEAWPTAGSERGGFDCNSESCVVGLRDGSGTHVVRVFPRGASLFGPSMDLASRVSRVHALAHGWVFETAEPPSISFYDDEWTLLGTHTRNFGGRLGCAEDYCAALDTDDIVRLTATTRTTLPIPAPERRATSEAPICSGDHCLVDVRVFSPRSGFISLPPGSGTGAPQTLAYGLTLAAGGPWARIRTAGLADYRWIDALARTPFGEGLGASHLVGGARGLLVFDEDGASLLDPSGEVVASLAPAPDCASIRDAVWSEDHWDGLCQASTPESAFIVAFDEGGAVLGPPHAIPGLRADDRVRLTRSGDALAVHQDRTSILRSDGTIVVAETRTLAPALGGFVWIDTPADALRLQVTDPDGVTRAVGDVPRDPRTLAGSPVVVFDGTHYLVAFGSGSIGSMDVRLVRMNVHGELMDAEPIHLAWSTDGPAASIVTDGNGHTWLAYTAFDFDLAVRNSRARPREIVTGDALGRACVDGSTCGSGECVDGICCSRACDGPCDVCTVAEGASYDGVCASACEDAGVPDAGVPDAGASDAAASDDASVSEDAAVDGGVLDAAVHDAGVRERDASSLLDAVAAQDAGAGPSHVSYCGCRAAGAGPRSSAATVVLALALVCRALRGRRRT